MSDRYPFGVVPADPFDLAVCPRCRNQVGPGVHHCGSCFATYDVGAARGAILATPELANARFALLALAPVAALGAAPALWLGSLWVPPWIGLVLSAIAVLGVVGWAAFARAPRVTTGLASLAWIALLGFALWGQAMMLTLTQLGSLRFGLLVVVALCLYMIRESGRGFVRAAALVKLQPIGRPAPRDETYR